MARPTTEQVGRSANLATACPAHVNNTVRGSAPQAGSSSASAARQVWRCRSTRISSAGRAPCIIIRVMRMTAGGTDRTIPRMPGRAPTREYGHDLRVQFPQADSDTQRSGAQLAFDRPERCPSFRIPMSDNALLALAQQCYEELHAGDRGQALDPHRHRTPKILLQRQSLPSQSPRPHLAHMTLNPCAPAESVSGTWPAAGGRRRKLGE